MDCFQCTTFCQGYFIYLLPSFLSTRHTFFFLHGQHPIAFLAHLYMFKCQRRSSSNSTHAGSRATLCERLCRTVESWLAGSPQLSQGHDWTQRLVTDRLLPGENLQFVFLTWLYLQECHRMVRCSDSEDFFITALSSCIICDWCEATMQIHLLLQASAVHYGTETLLIV